MPHEYDCRVRMSGQLGGQWYFDKQAEEERLAEFRRRRSEGRLGVAVSEQQFSAVTPSQCLTQNPGMLSYGDRVQILVDNLILSVNPQDYTLDWHENIHPATLAPVAPPTNRTVCTILPGPNRLRPARSNGDPVCYNDTVYICFQNAYLYSEYGVRGRGTREQPVVLYAGEPTGFCEWTVTPPPKLTAHGAEALIDGQPVNQEGFLLTHSLSGRFLGNSLSRFAMAIAMNEYEAVALAQRSTNVELHPAICHIVEQQE